MLAGCSKLRTLVEAAFHFFSFVAKLKVLRCFHRFIYFEGLFCVLIRIRYFRVEISLICGDTRSTTFYQVTSTKNFLIEMELLA